MESQRQERSSNPVRARRSKAVTIHGLRPGGPKGSTLATTTLQLTTTRPARSATAALEPIPGSNAGAGKPAKSSYADISKYLARSTLPPAFLASTERSTCAGASRRQTWTIRHIEWRGWGYRKIQAKHGWGSDDLEATRV